VAIDQTGMGNPAGLRAVDAKKLFAGGPVGGMRWLYPYEGTVFPRGMLAPILMWDGGQAAAAYLHIHSQTFDYKALLKAASGATQAPQLQIPPAAGRVEWPLAVRGQNLFMFSVLGESPDRRAISRYPAARVPYKRLASSRRAC
jgi:hypothetical protein